ncbi:MAG: phosphoribosylformimino-5-aminoimidazole carboxamide ribotide isomerase [Chitinispirillaceae bacterium]|nr:phosphoribosylformimino-5-aminoimidazole carboxamide ribotide isomerase [Chitinispirillaceae bacterium]
MRFRPCIDLHRGKVKQIVGSTLTDNTKETPVTNFESDKGASYFARLYRSDNLPGGHVIMLGPGNEAAAREALRAFPGGLQVGGGISPDNARSFIDDGASHVIVTSYVLSDGSIQRERLALIEKTAGRKHLVLDLSCRRTGDGYSIACDRWQKDSGVILTEKTVQELAVHCDEFLVHAVDVEGLRGGIDAGLVELLASISPITVTYAGGIRSIDDLDEVRTRGKGLCDATIGSALDIYGGPLKYRDVVAWQREQEKTVHSR